jgi:hypothetical protein
LAQAAVQNVVRGTGGVQSSGKRVERFVKRGKHQDLFATAEDLFDNRESSGHFGDAALGLVEAHVQERPSETATDFPSPVSWARIKPSWRAARA